LKHYGGVIRNDKVQDFKIRMLRVTRNKVYVTIKDVALDPSHQLAGDDYDKGVSIFIATV